MTRIANIGIDSGKKVDYAAIVVAELKWRDALPDPRTGRARKEDHWLIRRMFRVPLKTPYNELKKIILTLVKNVEQLQDVTLENVYLDATGGGENLADELHATAGLRVVRCTFNHGDRRVKKSRYEISIGKAWLVGRLQALAKSQRIHLPPDHHDAWVMREELLNYEIRVSEDAHTKYGAFRVGTHDDYVTALGEAVQEAKARAPVLARSPVEMMSREERERVGINRSSGSVF